MKTLYIECDMGAAGDMLSAALLELLPDREAFVERLNAAGIPGVRFEAEQAEKCGIRGTRMRVFIEGREEGHEHTHHHDHGDHGYDHDHMHHYDHDDHGYDHDHMHHYDHDDHGYDHEHMHHHDHGDHEHHHDYVHDDHGHHHEGHEHVHRGMADIAEIVSSLNVSEQVKDHVLAVYSMIAEAESHAHGKPVQQIHFHEVGTMDAVADVTAVSMLVEELAPDRICASPVHVGSGQVRCAHGILPVPAPATAYILRDVPTYGGAVQGELCTPTGAALLRHFAGSFGSQPPMKVDGIGYGMGTKDFPQANCVRVFLGESVSDDGSRKQPEEPQCARTIDAASDSDETRASSGIVEEVLELRCNLDDMTGEDIGYACEKLLEGGALDVWTEPAGMKKGRPGVLLCCLSRPADREKLVSLIFRHTSTIGVREAAMRRYALARSETVLNTEYGGVRVKKSEGFGVTRAKCEYEDLKKISEETGIPVSRLRARLDPSAGN